jgi:hypothetical protein
MTEIKPKIMREHTIREHPNITYWLEGKLALGKGNLILTSDRLIFLHKVQLTEVQKEQLLKLYKEAGFTESMEYAMKFHKNNFQIPLDNINTVSLGVFRYFPWPRFYMRVIYHGNKKSSQMETGFFFRMAPSRMLFQLELTFVWGWVNIVKGAVRKKWLSISS